MTTELERRENDHREIDHRESVTDGLIMVPDSPRRGLLDRLTRILVLSLVALVLVGTAIVNALLPLPDPELIGEERNAQVKMRATARLGDGSLARLVEYDLRITSRVRQWVSKPYASLLFKHLKEVRGSALLGKDGWLFLTKRVEPPELMSAVMAERGAAVLSAVDRRLSSLGARLLVVPIPRKSALYAHLLPRGVDPRGDIESMFMNELGTRGVDAVDLPTLFRREKDQILYYPTGTHWTQAGEVVAARAVIEHAGLLAPETEHRTELRMVGLKPRTSRRDLLLYLDVDLDQETQAELRSLKLKRYSVFDPAGSAKLAATAESNGRLAIAGTSFTAGSQFAEFLSHFAQEPIWNASLPAVHALTSLLDLTRKSAGRKLPERILLELPIHQIFRPPPPTAGEFFAENPPRESIVVVPSQELDAYAETVLGEVRFPMRTNVLAVVPDSHLVHSGAGVVAVRLRGAVGSGEVRIKIGSEPYMLTAPWRETVNEMVLPIVAPRGEIVIAAEGPRDSVLAVESLEIVSGLSAEYAALGEVSAPRSDDEGWQQPVHFPTGPLLVKHDALVIELAADRSVHHVDVRVETVATNSPPIRLRVSTLDPNARIVVDVGSAAGGSLKSVTLRGRGDVPGMLAKRVRLLSSEAVATDVRSRPVNSPASALPPRRR